MGITVVGRMVGDDDIGVAVGKFVGTSDGITVGSAVGRKVGIAVG